MADRDTVDEIRQAARQLRGAAQAESTTAFCEFHNWDVHDWADMLDRYAALVERTTPQEESQAPDEITRLRARTAELESVKNGAYDERNQLVAALSRRDAKVFDGQPFNGRTVAEYFGNQGAAIAALAKILQQMLQESLPKEQHNV